jgi:hypothetical protein
MALEREIATYEKRLPELLADGHSGEFVLIKDDEVVGVYGRLELATEEGYRRYGLEPFFVKKVEPPNPPYVTRNLVPCPTSEPSSESRGPSPGSE